MSETYVIQPRRRSGGLLWHLFMGLVGLVLFSVVLTFFMNGKDLNRISIFGYRLSYVVSASMEPTLKTHALCLMDMRARDYQEGDIIVYEHKMNGFIVLICHRIVGFTADGKLITKGDNNKVKDPWLTPPDAVVGKIIKVWNGFADIINKF